MTDNTWIDPFTSIRKDTLAELNANYEAALARAETAETEREVWRLRHRAIYNKYDDTRDERESLIARVDELEREYAAALARIAQLEAAAKRYRELTFAAGFYGCPSCEAPLVLPALFPLTDDTELTEEEYDDGPEVETAPQEHPEPLSATP